MMETALIEVALRMAHIGAAIVWIGHNYATAITRPRFVPFSGEAASDGDFQSRMRREHGIFRWSSVVAWSAGLAMLWRHGQLPDALVLAPGTEVIGLGAWIGTVMMLNVWLVLWPHQKKVLGFVAAPHDERVRCSRITFLSARVNTVLSLPLLFLMVAGAHGAL